MNQIETNRILFLDPSLTKASSIKDWGERHGFRTCMFAKYFPKYLRNFEFQTKSSSIKYKIKSIKVMKDFRYPSSSPSSKALEYRLLFANKARFIKSIEGNQFQSPDQLLEKLKLFTNLKSIKLFFRRDSSISQRIECYYLIKTLTKIKRLKKLQSLEFHNLTNPSASLIHVIDADSKALSRLKALTLSLRTVEGDDDEILQTLKYCKNTLKYLTCLHLPALRSPLHYKDFKSLENSCPNLKTLSFEFACRDIIYSTFTATKYLKRCFPVEINYLSAIKAFHNLISLSLSIADIFTFLKDFSLPPSIRSLTLNFAECLTKEILTRIDKQFIGQNERQTLEFFETNNILTKFYENFEQLSSLNTLEMFFSRDVGPEDYQHHNYLAQNLLKKIPSLNKLSFAGGYSYCGLNNCFRSSVQDQDLPQFLMSSHPSGQTLQSLEIGHDKVIFSNFNLFSSRNKFPSLSTITLTGAVHQNDPSNTEIGAFLKQIITLGTSLETIKFHTFINGSIKSLLSLLQQLNELHKPEKLQLKLEIKFFKSQPLENLRAGFTSVIQELQENELDYAKLQGVSLLIYMNEAKHAKDFLKIYGEKFDNFIIYGLGYDFGHFQ